MKKITPAFLFLILMSIASLSFAGASDTAVIASIRKAAYGNKQARELLSTLCDTYGPRLMWSGSYDRSAEYLTGYLNKAGITDVTKESIGQKGRPWQSKYCYASLTKPFRFVMQAYPSVWSPSTPGVVNGGVVFLDAREDKDLEKFRGKLKGKIVMVADPYPGNIWFKAPAERYSDSALMAMASYVVPTPAEKAAQARKDSAQEASYNAYYAFISRKVKFCTQEGALLLLVHGLSGYGVAQVWGTIQPTAPRDVFDFLISLAADPGETKALPMITLTLENYNLLVRCLYRGQTPEMEAHVETETGSPVDGYSIIAEIPGTDLKNEVVMLGAHFDTYPTGTGAADNTAGVVICTEALRLIKSLGLQPRRTIRIALWGAEEEGLVGSKAYVKKHFRQGSGEKCYLYLNTDMGVGKYRGLYMEENSIAMNVLREWMRLIGNRDFQTLTAEKTDNTDHVSFDKAGLPGFQFIQDKLDYFKIYHTNVDVVEHIPSDDLKHNIFIMTALAYLASVDENPSLSRTP